MTWSISKQFDFCYGHRVWSQTLNTEFSLDGCLACRHLHGHQGKIVVYLKSDKLENGMVTDFNHLNWFKQFLDDTLDHKFIIDINDPLFETMLPHYKDKENLYQHPQNYRTPDLNHIKGKPSHIYEMYEGFIIVDFVPTSENISAWLLQIVQKKMMEININVSHIEFFETPKSRSTVYVD
ncbi:MAG: 6-carboxytetrahydropterin synthase [Epsilonproteobacteria bacterium]|nr:MAG: 6-carboxytetrahydropterin synthase [Campylobacterota bacterium]